MPHDHPIPYTLKTRKSARGIRIAIHPGGEVKVTAPPYISAHIIDDFIAQKSAWIKEKHEHLKKFPKRKSAQERKKEYKEYKEQARNLVEERLKHFNTIYQFKYNKIYIRNQRSRWGSCSTKGNISFNYKIFFLPPQLADYIVVHELCHVRQMNHSKNFWNLVAQVVPEHTQLRKELKNCGNLLS